jgi:hypothetical protein
VRADIFRRLDAETRAKYQEINTARPRGRFRSLRKGVFSPALCGKLLRTGCWDDYFPPDLRLLLLLLLSQRYARFWPEPSVLVEF